MKRKVAILLVLSMVFLLLSGCKVKSKGDLVGDPSAQNAMAESYDFTAAAEKLSAASGKAVSVDMLKKIGQEKTVKLVEKADSGSFSDKSWLEVTGYTYLANVDVASGAALPENVRDFGNNGKDYFDVSFVGDVLYDPDFPPMERASRLGGAVNCFDEEVVERLTTSDITLINNEFTIGTQGSPLKGKTWTFQADPDCIQIHKDLGADIVSLANNHVYDYGETGFLDTLDHLKNAGMPYVGAGRNVEEAGMAQYFIVNGVKVGIIAASRAEKKFFTPVATADKPGVMGTYESAEFLDAIKEADAQCDILIAYVHWGTEGTTKLEDAQKDMAREYIDAGVDAVVGGHPHRLQGLEFYNNKPIAYSLGNFWFASYKVDTTVLTLRFDGDMNVKTMIMPLVHKNCEVNYLSDPDEQREFYDKIEGFAPQKVTIDDDGTVTAS